MKQKSILIILLILSIITIILNDFIFSNTIEIIPIGNELGQILSNLSLAYISSYIFYLLVVVTKEKKDRKNVYNSVYHLTNSLIAHGYSIYDEIIEASGADKSDYNKKTISEDDYFKLCEISDIRYTPKNRFFGSPFNPRYANLAQHIYNGTVTQTNRYIEKVFEFMPFLDSDFIALLNKLRHSGFFKMNANMLVMVTQGNVPNQKVGKWESMYEYLEIIREIEKYNERHHSKFK